MGLLVGVFEGWTSPSRIAVKRRYVKGSALNDPAKGPGPLET